MTKHNRVIYECMMAIKLGCQQQDVLILHFCKNGHEVFNRRCDIIKNGSIRNFKIMRKSLYQDFQAMLEDLPKGDELRIYNGKVWGQLSSNQKERFLLYSPLSWWQKIGLTGALKNKANTIIQVKD